MRVKNNRLDIKHEKLSEGAGLERKSHTSTTRSVQTFEHHIGK